MADNIEIDVPSSVSGNIEIDVPSFTPGSANSTLTLSNSGETGFEIVNNTTLRIKYKGSDNVVRSADLTLS